ncbi:MAG: HAD family phosphatase [Actinomycetota bacterium]|nr:HAD family phosphatase [Actinomycetota bacterium]
MPVAAVVFDLDGVLLDSETIWNEVKREVVVQTGGRWRDDAPHDMMGMSSGEWSRYLHEELAVPLSPPEIDAAVVSRVAERYRRRLPLLPGAAEAVERMAARWPLGLASSSNRPIIDLALEASGLARWFRASVSSEEVGRGKPAPDVYLAAVTELGVAPSEAAAIEDSSNGILAARAAGMRAIAIPNPHYPPSPEALAAADAVLPSLDDLLPNVVSG